MDAYLARKPAFTASPDETRFQLFLESTDPIGHDRAALAQVDELEQKISDFSGTGLGGTVPTDEEAVAANKLVEVQRAVQKKYDDSVRQTRMATNALEIARRGARHYSKRSNHRDLVVATRWTRIVQHLTQRLEAHLATQTAKYETRKKRATEGQGGCTAKLAAIEIDVDGGGSSEVVDMTSDTDVDEDKESDTSSTPQHRIPRIAIAHVQSRVAKPRKYVPKKNKTPPPAGKSVTMSQLRRLKESGGTWKGERFRDGERGNHGLCLRDGAIFCAACSCTINTRENFWDRLVQSSLELRIFYLVNKMFEIFV